MPTTSIGPFPRAWALVARATALPVCAMVPFVCATALLAWTTALPPIRAALADEAPIASARHSTGKARADILSLRRTEGETLTLRFAVANDTDKGLSLNLREVGLVDLVNRRSYTPGVTSSSFCSIAPAERTVCWAVFGSPGGGVKTINVRIPEGFDLVSAPIGD